MIEPILIRLQVGQEMVLQYQLSHLGAVITKSIFT